MKDPKLIVYQNSMVVVIRDKYPKSEMHFLILPQAKIPEIRSLNRSHLPLMRHMKHIFCKIFDHESYTFWCGFHAKPTMMQLHMHVISDDLRGSGMKTAKHWNSYTTSFFISLTKVIGDLESHGRVLLEPPAVLDNLLRAPLKCHQCNYHPVNMPTLKVHLLSHIPIN